MSEYIRRELEKMELPEAALDIIENLQSRTQAAEEMADAANRQAQQAIQQLYDEKEHIRKERVEIVRERNNRVNEYRIRAEAAEQERDRAVTALREIEIECRRGLDSSHIAARHIAIEALKQLGRE